MAKAVWGAIVPLSRQHDFLLATLSNWLVPNLGDEHNMDYAGINWCILFRVVCWQIWMSRNIVFLYKTANANSSAILTASVSWAATIQHAEEWRKLSNAHAPSVVSWNAPDSGWVKVNVDGALHVGLGWTSVGGVVRDEAGRWLLDFGRSLEWGTSLRQSYGRSSLDSK
ncbi:hypothetical protein GOBAR_DD07633 [Gossypium barbadense]|nr:hypothetical protein GOBAR_DD07633 [Gossypium barbadense]